MLNYIFKKFGKIWSKSKRTKFKDFEKYLDWFVQNEYIQLSRQSTAQITSQRILP